MIDQKVNRGTHIPIVVDVVEVLAGDAWRHHEGCSANHCRPRRALVDFATGVGAAGPVR
jgi:hypothetical protein